MPIWEVTSRSQGVFSMIGFSSQSPSCYDSTISSLSMSHEQKKKREYSDGIYIQLLRPQGSYGSARRQLFYFLLSTCCPTKAIWCMALLCMAWNGCTISSSLLVSSSVHLWEPVHCLLICLCFPGGEPGWESQGYLVDFWLYSQ